MENVQRRLDTYFLISVAWAILLSIACVYMIPRWTVSGGAGSLPALFCLISVAVNIFSVPYVYGKLIRAREGRQVVVVCRNETECRHENVTRQGTTSQAPAPDSENGLHLVLLARSSSRLVGMELTVGFLWEVPLDKVEYVRHEKLVDAYAVKLLGWQNEDKDSARARFGGDGAPR